MRPCFDVSSTDTYVREVFVPFKWPICGKNDFDF